MFHPFKYVGCFINHADLHSAISGVRQNPLKNDIQDPHITFVYMPKKVDRSLFGKQIGISIVGYGNNGINEGLLVHLQSDDPKVQAMIEEIEVPHITISVGDDGKPINTKFLRFESIEPIEMTGKYGGYTKRGKVIVDNRRKRWNLISDRRS